MNGLLREMVFQNIFYFHLWLPSILIIDWDGHNSKQFSYNIYEIVGREKLELINAEKFQKVEAKLIVKYDFVISIIFLT